MIVTSYLLMPLKIGVELERITCMRWYMTIGWSSVNSMRLCYLVCAVV